MALRSYDKARKRIYAIGGEVERYDRKHLTIDGAPGVERLHQEDFCQAQNIVS